MRNENSRVTGSIQTAFPFGPSDVKALEMFLRQLDIFCAEPPELDPYSLVVLHEQQAHFQTRVFALFDRNILQDVISTANGIPVATCERVRIGAAVMAFLQASNISIEPNISLYEHPDSAKTTLGLFRRADNVDPQIYADIALGRLERLPADALPQLASPLPAVDFSRKPKGWGIQYACVLKMAELELTPMKPFERASSYLRWLWADLAMSPAGLLIAVSYFSPSRKKPMIHGLRKSNRPEVLKNLSGAAWDLTLIREWTKRVRQQVETNTLWLLCSRDEPLTRIARMVHLDDEVGSPDTVIRGLLIANWGKKMGNALADLTKSLNDDAANPSRRIHNERKGFISKLTTDLETAILSWVP